MFKPPPLCNVCRNLLYYVFFSISASDITSFPSVAEKMAVYSIFCVNDSGTGSCIIALLLNLIRASSFFSTFKLVV